jgi:hypothetical protein
MASSVPADRVLVAVRQHDDVASLRPEPIARTDLDPAPSGRDDVEHDESLGARVQRLRHNLGYGRLISPCLGELGAKENRSGEAHAAQRGVERAPRGVTARSRGVAVMVVHRQRHEYRV